MKIPIPNYARRRLLLMVVLTALAAAAGFAWGQQYGYHQGRNDVMRQVEKRLKAAPMSTVLNLIMLENGGQN